MFILKNIIICLKHYIKYHYYILLYIINVFLIPYLMFI